MSKFEWTHQQSEALHDIADWLREPLTPANQVRKLFGYAGTGKSTMAKEINGMVGGRALPCAYTGKAASVMARKGLPGATTVHRLIYDPMGDGKEHVRKLEEELRLLERVEDKSRGLAMRLAAVRRSLEEAKKNSGPQFILKEESEISSAPLVLLDECSMVAQRMAEDLLSFGVRVLVMGDPAQLPPVRGTGFFMDGRIDNMLTDIRRQALDNPIIRLATDVREGRSLAYGDYGESSVVQKVTAEQAVGHEQVLCGTNKMRMNINARRRQIDERTSPFPQVGERLVCLRNDHDLGLLNGTLWNSLRDTAHPYDDDGQVYLSIEPEEGGQPLGIPAEASLFINEATADVSWRSRGQQFTYGYALTVHKSQGSQFDSVLIFDDWHNSESHRQWLYTGITRAAVRVTVVM